MALDLLEEKFNGGAVALPEDIAALRDRAARYRDDALRAVPKQPIQVVGESPCATLTTKEVAALFGCSVQYVTAEARAGRLPASSRRPYRFDVLAVDEYRKGRQSVGHRKEPPKEAA